MPVGERMGCCTKRVINGVILGDWVETHDWILSDIVE